MTEYDEGETVEWTIDNGLYKKDVSGEILETGIEKFGYDDVIKVKPESEKGEDVVYVRPVDLD